MARRATPKETLAKSVEKTVATPQSAPAGAGEPETAKLETGKPETSKPETGRIETLIGSSILPAMIRVGDAEVQLGKIVAAAHTASGLSLDDWNALEDAPREALLQAEIDRRRAEVAAAPAPEPVVEEQEDLHLGRIWSEAEIDEQVTGAVAHFRDAVARNREQGLALLANARTATERTDAALVALLMEFGVAVAGALLAPEPAPAPLPADVPEGKVRVQVKGPQAGRRRLGRQFGPAPTDLDVTEDELAALAADATLTVKPVEPVTPA